MAAFVINTIKSQFPLLIEKYEPEIEGKLRESLRTIKATHPSESQLFLSNWTKLNKAVQEELATTPVMGGKKKQKTRKVHKKRT